MKLLEWDNSEQAAKLKRYDAEKVKAKETLYKSKHGPKRYKEFMKKDAEAKDKPIKNPKGVRALPVSYTHLTLPTILLV